MQGRTSDESGLAQRAAGAGSSSAAAEAYSDAGFSVLSMYADAPNEEITLEDFELHAFDRLKVLRGIEMLVSRGLKRAEVHKEARKLAEDHIGKSLNNPETWRKDLVSHHILRLAFCNSEEKRRFFITQETTLFRARLEKQTPEQVADFMARHDISLTPVTDEDKLLHIEQLRTVYLISGSGDAAEEETHKPNFQDTPFENVRYFLVPFTKAIDLLRGRRVFLSSGNAYVPRGRIISIIVGRFKEYLEVALSQCNKALPKVLRDERMGPILHNMANAYTGPEINSKDVGRIGPEDVDKLAREAFPLCMANMNEAMRRDHHLKHEGRQQYGLFLKGIGLTLEDSLQYWQREFTKKMTPEEFIKKYSYNIRHSYGKEGARKDYRPMDCIKIIQGAAPTKEQAHGCPYRHWDTNRLKAVLSSPAMRLPPSAVDDIMESVGKRDYQIACRKQFDARFPGCPVDIGGSVGNHPNNYFIAAYKFAKKQQEGAKSGGADDGVGAGAGSGNTGFTAASVPRNQPSASPAAAATAQAAKTPAPVAAGGATSTPS